MINKKTGITAGIFLAGIFFMIAGICMGEAETVMHKAVRICLECIGIG